MREKLDLGLTKGGLNLTDCSDLIMPNQSVTTKSNKFDLFSLLREPSANRKDIRALILVEPPRNKPEQGPKLYFASTTD